MKVLAAFANQIDLMSVVTYVIGTIRLLILMTKSNTLALELVNSIKQVVAKKLTDDEMGELGDEEKEQWCTMLANSVATLLMATHYELAQDLTMFIMNNSPKIREMMLC